MCALSPATHAARPAQTPAGLLRLSPQVNAQLEGNVTSLQSQIGRYQEHVEAVENIELKFEEQARACLAARAPRASGASAANVVRGF